MKKLVSMRESSNVAREGNVDMSIRCQLHVLPDAAL